jgi:hypothetical protein
MNWNFFKSASPLFPFRWLIIATLVLAGWLLYADRTGWRIATFSNQQQWTANGLGHHK